MKTRKQRYNYELKYFFEILICHPLSPWLPQHKYRYGYVYHHHTKSLQVLPLEQTELARDSQSWIP